MPDEEFDVEIIDVTRDEAQNLPFSMDPLAALAGKDDAALAQLWATTEADERINLGIVRTLSKAWSLFAPHHYLSDDLNNSAVCLLAIARVEGDLTVFEEIFEPGVELGGVKVEFIAEIGNGNSSRRRAV
jgi:hypothetical protein